MGSNSSSTSSSNGCTVSDQGTSYVRSVIEHNNPDHDCYISHVYWNYKSAGKNNFHRFLEFKFVCNNCNFIKFVRMDKTVDGIGNGEKNICVADNLVELSGLWYWDFTPRNHYNINDLIRKFDSVTSYYHWVTNNSSHFAKKIWDSID